MIESHCVVVITELGTVAVSTIFWRYAVNHSRTYAYRKWFRTVKDTPKEFFDFRPTVRE